MLKDVFMDNTDVQIIELVNMDLMGALILEVFQEVFEEVFQKVFEEVLKKVFQETSIILLTSL